VEDQKVVEAFLPHTPARSVRRSHWGVSYDRAFCESRWHSLSLPEHNLVQICNHYHISNTSVLVQMVWLLGAVRATQGSVGDRVTPTWITFRDLCSMRKNACERSKEEICDQKARHKPRSVRHDCAQRLPTSGLVAGVYEHVSYTSPMVRLQTRMPSFRSSPRILSAPQSRFFLAISLINVIVSAVTLGV
jgi:hypothetical protein